MSDIISAGAYVIRNKKTSTVLHIENAHMHSRWSPVVSHGQAENQYHDQQIWWVEPLTNTQDSEGNEGVVYSISNPPSGNHLGGHDGGKVTVCRQEGGPWQWWRFRRVPECNDGVYYHIVTARNRLVSLTSKDSKWSVGNQDIISSSDECCWEFVIPAVGYPPGWIHIQNAKTGDLLSHAYLHEPPVLLTSPSSPRPSQYHEEWQFQWTIASSEGLWPTSTLGANSWGIKNRLTGAFLAGNEWRVPGVRFGGFNAWKVTSHNSHDLIWKLELDRSCNWKIVNLETHFLLQQTSVPRNGGMQVECADKSFSLKDGTKSWVLRLPLLETNDESPPDYKA